MNITLDMPVGQWRNLSEIELKTINRLIDNSSNTA